MQTFRSFFVIFSHFLSFFLAYVVKKLYLCSRKQQRFANMNDYRFTNIDQEPTDEQLSQLMREVAEEAKERWDKARTAYFAHIDQMVQAI